VADEEVGDLLRRFTLFDRPSIERLEGEHAERPEARRAQLALARDITARVHGPAAADGAAEESRVRFGRAAAATITATDSPPDFEVGQAALASGVDFAVAAGAASSRSEARRLIEQGGLTVNDERLGAPMEPVPDRLGGRFVVRVGKKRVLIGRLTDSGA
jgi:tyrosyl-tRNA synthetase